MKIGSIEWTNRRLYIRWQAVRRDDEYKAFCDKHNEYFNIDGMLEIWRLPTDEAEREIKEVQDRWGLDIIYHYNVDHDIDYFIDDNVFENPFAIDFLLKDEESENLDPFWDKNHIVLKVNVDGSIPEAQLKDEFLEYVKAARESVSIKQVRSIPDDTDFRVYDMFKDGWASKEIIKEIWPDKYKIEFGGLAVHEMDELYERLSLEYQKQGLKDWDERAFRKAYQDDQEEGTEDYNDRGGRITLFMRVHDRIERVKRYIDRLHVKR